MGDIGHKNWWGPRIWRILHCLAEISDRPQCVVGWRHMFRATELVLPCEMCRRHFQAAVRGFRLQSGAPLRHMLWATHAASRAGGDNLPEAELSAVYGYGGDRGAVVTEVLRLVAEVVGAFRGARLQLAFLAEWERVAGRLARSLLLPPPPPAPVISSRARGRPGRAR
jgi:hypothetical protein